MSDTVMITRNTQLNLIRIAKAIEAQNQILLEIYKDMQIREKNNPHNEGSDQK